MAIEDKFDDDIQNLIEVGKEKGYLTYGDVNDMLPEEMGTADDLDDPMLPNDKAGRLQRQTTELRTLLEGAGPLSRPSRLAAELARGVSTADLVKLRLLAAGISDRDLEVLRLLAAGHTNSVIANLQTRSLRGVEASRARVRQLLGLQTRAELVQFARDAGLE